MVTKEWYGSLRLMQNSNEAIIPKIAAWVSVDPSQEDKFNML